MPGVQKKQKRKKKEMDNKKDQKMNIERERGWVSRERVIERVSMKNERVR